MDRKQQVINNIALMIKASSKSQTEIARELETDKSVISDYVSGKNLPSILVLIKLCKVLECNYEDILGPL